MSSGWIRKGARSLRCVAPDDSEASVVATDVASLKNGLPEPEQKGLSSSLAGHARPVIVQDELVNRRGTHLRPPLGHLTRIRWTNEKGERTRGWRCLGGWILGRGWRVGD